jgi:hypothetical protein
LPAVEYEHGLLVAQVPAVIEGFLGIVLMASFAVCFARRTLR